jgi:hypothetical protein
MTSQEGQSGNVANKAAETEIGRRYTRWKLALAAILTVLGVGLWMGWRGFFATQPILKAPRLNSPHFLIGDPKPTFKWTKVEGATRYELWAMDVTNVTEGEVYQPLRKKSVTGTSFVPTEEIPTGKTYDVWVRACKESPSNCGPWSSKLRFYMRIAPRSAPTLIRPVGSINNPKPTFEWSTLSEANLYDLWVYDKTNEYLEFHVKDLPTTRHNMEYALLEGVEYWVKVRGCSEGESKSYLCGPWSDVQTFSIIP